MDKRDEELEILRRLERAVFAGDALACSPLVPLILTEYLIWSRESQRALAAGGSDEER